MGSKLLSKQPWEKLLYDMDFSKQMLAADTIALIDSITITPAGEVTVTDEVASGQLAQAFFEGGVDARRYQVRFRVTTTHGEKLEADGELLIAEK